MRLGAFSWVAEGKGWRCTDNPCRKFASLIICSFPEGFNFPIAELVECTKFEGINRETKDIFMITVHNRTANTLIPIIGKYILPGLAQNIFNAVHPISKDF